MFIQNKNKNKSGVVIQGGCQIVALHKKVIVKKGYFYLSGCVKYGVVQFRVKNMLFLKFGFVCNLGSTILSCVTSL